jgi:hypothetical protein
LWWQVLARNPWIEDFCIDNPGSILFGETFGWIQSLRYGAVAGDHWFRAFDVMDPNGAFLTFLLGLPDVRSIVPILYSGPYDATAIPALMSGPSTVGPNIREGCVIKPLVERWNEEIGRVILKAVSPAYLEKY